MGQARSRHLDTEFLFDVEDVTSGLLVAKFNKATGLEASAEIIEYSEGGAIAPIKEPGKVSYSNITLSRGVDSDQYLYNWWKQVIDMRKAFPEGAGTPTLEGLLRDIVIVQKERDQSPLREYACYSCFPTRYKPANFDNDSSAYQAEEVELAVWFIERADL